MESLLRGARVAITGGTGAFGQKFVSHLAEIGVRSVTLVSRDEMKHAAMKRQFSALSEILRYQIGDINESEDLDRAFKDVDLVVHAAAMKHLPECEANISASLKANVDGTRSVVRAFERSQAKTLIFLSTDKAPYASSVYGAQKYIGEKLVLECAGRLPAGRRALSLRYSNVIDSTGAVFHLFGPMLRDGKKVTVNGTHTKRGFVTQREVISTIEAAMATAKGGETIVLRPRVIAISDLAAAMQKLVGRGEVEIKETTAYAGEKDSATLIMEEELSFACDFPEATKANESTTAYIVDCLRRHQGRAVSRFAEPGSLTLEQCEVITGTALEEFLGPVMKSCGY